jgi:RNase P subunit RPR2
MIMNKMRHMSEKEAKYLDDVTETIKLAKVSSIINAHEANVQKIIHAAEEFATNLGTKIGEVEQNYCTKCTYQLKNFYNFEIRLRSGMSMMGGNHITLNYRNSPVFDAFYHSSLDKILMDETEVKTYNTKTGWDEQFMEYAENSNKYLREFKKKQEKEKMKSQKDYNQILESASTRQELKAKAKRLGMIS